MTAKRESSLRRQVVLRLRAHGWLAVVQHGGVYSQVGVADILGCAWGTFFALEIKTPEGELTPAQRQFLRRVRRAGGIAGVARTPDEAEDLILGKLDNPTPHVVGDDMAAELEDLDLDDLLGELDADTQPAPPPTQAVSVEAEDVEDDLFGDDATPAPVPEKPKRGRKPRTAESEASTVTITESADDLDMLSDDPLDDLGSMDADDDAESGRGDDAGSVSVGNVRGVDPFSALCERLDQQTSALVAMVEVMTGILEEMRGVATAPTAAPRTRRKASAT